MKNLIFILLLVLANLIGYSQIDTTKLINYNQNTPGDIPVIFAPEIISKEGCFEYPCSFSKDMTEMYFGVNMYFDENKDKYILQVKKQSDGTWTLPQKISFTGYPESEPILSPDNYKLFFAVLSDSTKVKPHDIWYVNRVGDGWSEPIKLNNNINTEKYEYFASMTTNNKIYFTREGKGIFSAEFINNDFCNVQLIDQSINNFKFCGHPFVSPDESYIIFDSRERGGFGKADLYIAFKEGDRWGNPINLRAEINTCEIEFMPIVTPDGKYLFFCRKEDNERDIYWVKFDAYKYKK